jgi:hypothetical protein
VILRGLASISTRRALAPALAAALAALALAAAPLRAQLEVEGHVSVHAEGMRLLSKHRLSPASEFNASASGLDAQVFVPRYWVGLAFASYSAGEAAEQSDRYAISSFSAIVGTRRYAAELGSGRRSGFSTLPQAQVDESYEFYRVGARVSVPLGHRGFSVGLRGAAIVAAGENTENGARGFDAASELRWTSDRFPITAAVAYRAERMRVSREAEQEVSMLTLSAGWAFKWSP